MEHDGLTEQNRLQLKLLDEDDSGDYLKLLNMDSEIRELTTELDYMQKTDNSKVQYFDTAGEIEARETANRLKMTAEQRTQKTPDLGWERTVFAEGAQSGYDLDKNLGKQIEDWKNGLGKKYGTYNGKYFKLGTIPSIFVKHGAPPVDLIMYEDCIVKVTGGKHDIDLDELSKLPSQLNDPILLFKGSQPESFVALTELKSKQGNDVVVAVHIKKRFGRTEINKIASVHSRANDYGENRIIQYVNNQINLGNLLDASIKKAPIWFTSKGLQLPKLVQTIIDANTRIAQNDSSVNNEFMQDSQNNSEIKKSLKAETETPTAIDRYYAEAIRENRAFSQIFALMGDIYSSKMGEVYLDNADIRKTAKGILKEFGSKYDEKALADELQIVYDYMANNRGNVIVKTV